ncbi:tRNA pseudouridine synthase B [Bartonella bacilliformis str. Heidi Mejia]|uniref:tRNA pseudouridine(55) synthase TruB n=1 Tax=Bartonella bacilliformis TaxID=774 RepID=UPI00044B2263|nr:tRNA pseudouridine(55) synthase TruB [Bartonella bacilliformis]EYS90934.1 tRNA pseudouridine synthase B [Bartonella bacilliformis str. Heidi Mejia]KEG17488.1 tRNA pseudouridine synthase B [Bartonella bacilliformis Hosp800-02]KEG21873.1 tRNA pseudouridine synthase B [Bartonella bacilliformis VAB9028]KEG23248.1 tRNA pseudouridine synthase B [Bartonella bacilliformis CAR600-02]
MSRQSKKKGRSISGWVILDKPKAMKSTEAVSKIKRLFNAQKAGHAGTLDPLASGLLPIALGEATKTVPYVMEGTKTYHFHVAWGEERSTDDLEGVVTKTSSKRPTQEEIFALLPKYTGVILQTPPQFSAIKIAGNRAYDLAREGEIFEIPPRQVKIDSLELIGTTDQGYSIFEMTCGKGTYVRSLARDMGHDLGCYGYIADLRRTAVAPFCENDLITWDALKAAIPHENTTDENCIPLKQNFSTLDGLLIETDAALKCLAHYTLNQIQAQRVRMGNSILLCDQNMPTSNIDICVTYKAQLLAIGTIDQNQFKPKRIFTTL